MTAPFGHVGPDIRSAQVQAGQVQIWWLGQNAVVLKTHAGRIVMIDPYFPPSEAREPGKFIYDEPPIAPDDLRPDAVFCTHNHGDHTDMTFLPPLAAASAQTRFFGPPESVAAMAEAGIGAGRCVTVKPGATLELDGYSVLTVRSKLANPEIVEHYGFVFDVDGVRVWNSGDITRGVTAIAELMGPLEAARPDVAMIVMSPTEEEFPDFTESAELARRVGASVAIPSHYNCFAKRTWDPAGFASQFRPGDATQAVVIPFCGMHVHGGA